MEKEKFLLIKSNYRTFIPFLMTFIGLALLVSSVFSQESKYNILCFWCKNCDDYCQSIDVIIENNHVTVNVDFSINREKYPDLKKLTVIIPNKFESLKMSTGDTMTNKSAYVIVYPTNSKKYNVDVVPVNDITKAIIDLTPGCMSFYGTIDCRVSYRYSLVIPIDEEGKKTLIYNPPKTEEFNNIPTYVLIRGIGINNKILYSSINSAPPSEEKYAFKTSKSEGEIAEPIEIEWREQNIPEKYVFGLSKIYWFSFIYAFFMIPSVFLFGSLYKLNNRDKLKAILLCLISYVILLPIIFWGWGSLSLFGSWKSVSFFSSFFCNIPLAVLLSIWFKPKYSFTKTVIISVIIASVLTALGFYYLSFFD